MLAVRQSSEIPVLPDTYFNMLATETEVEIEEIRFEIAIAVELPSRLGYWIGAFSTGRRFFNMISLPAALY